MLVFYLSLEARLIKVERTHVSPPCGWDGPWVSEKILALDRRLRALPTHRAEFKQIVKMVAMRPLTAVHSSRRG